MQHQFKKDATKAEPFHVTADKSVDASLMHQTEQYGYYEGETFQMLELPYAGGALVYALGSTGQEEGHGGVALRPGVGVVLGRLTEIQVRLDAGYQVSTWVEQDARGREHRSHGPMMYLALVK